MLSLAMDFADRGQCDGEFPCKRCKDDGLVCTAGTRKKMEYKQLPRGYALTQPPPLVYL